MFFYLSKILYYLFSPALLVAIALVWAYFTKRPKLKKYLTITGISLFLLFTNPFVINELLKQWEYPATDMQQMAEKYDVGIVLTGMVNMSTGINDRVHFSKGVDRLLHTVQLYKRGVVQKILITGGTGSLVNTKDSESEQLLSFLLEMDIPRADIIIEPKSRNTHENAVFTVELLRKEYPEYSRFLLITSAFHMRRSYGCFWKAGIQVTPFPTDFYTAETRYYPNNLFVPNESAMFRWFLLYHEVLGYITYKLLGYC